MHSNWDEFYVAGAMLIERRLKEWTAERPGARVIVLVAGVSDVSAVRRALKTFIATGGKVSWFAHEEVEKVQSACRGIDGVKVFAGATLREAVNEAARPLHELNTEDESLRDFLRYKINCSFMRNMEVTALEEAINALVRSLGRKFDVVKFAPHDANSVESFRVNDFAYLEGFRDEKIRLMKERIMQVGPTDLGVLVLGETGTGKEAVALYLHEFSERRQGPFVSINCAGLDETFLRSELFGHVKGAFTGAVEERQGLVQRAQGGTLFLDELADMPLPIQADLLRFLQTKMYRRLGEDKPRESNVRFIAATQPILREKMRKGEFRQDLYYRVAEVCIETPRLAEVPDDILNIVRFLCYNEADKKPNSPLRERIPAVRAYFEKGKEVLCRYAWPGNVRELSSCVRRKMQLNDDVIAELKERMATEDKAASSNGNGNGQNPFAKLKEIAPLKTMTRDYVKAAWETRGSMTQKEVAQRLEISVNTLKEMLK